MQQTSSGRCSRIARITPPLDLRRGHCSFAIADAAVALCRRSTPPPPRYCRRPLPPPLSPRHTAAADRMPQPILCAIAHRLPALPPPISIRKLLSCAARRAVSCISPFVAPVAPIFIAIRAVALSSPFALFTPSPPVPRPAASCAAAVTWSRPPRAAVTSSWCHCLVLLSSR